VAPELILQSCFNSSSPEETIAIAEQIAGFVEKGCILALQGPLGAGKTCFVKGIARFFGVEEEITSPTYTIVSEYVGKMNGQEFPLYHIDAYRLQGDDDFYALGGEEYLFGRGISVVEWSERIPHSLPAETWIVNIEITGPCSRKIRMSRREI
jgi:tRNA threonylcarbamoyladenosine biosynthesis protein TsaE